MIFFSIIVFQITISDGNYVAGRNVMIESKTSHNVIKIFFEPKILTSTVQKNNGTLLKTVTKFSYDGGYSNRS